ncbi:hypothetical protein H0H93_011802, partial [Arthromyces matolae]
FAQGTFESDYAGFQQYTLTYEATTAKISKNLSYEDVATIPVALTAAYVGLYNSKPYGLSLAWPTNATTGQGKYTNKPILILGGSSSVGQFGESRYMGIPKSTPPLTNVHPDPAIQLAKLSGFSPIITTSSLKHTSFLKSLGATHVLDRNLPTPSLKSALSNLTNEPIDIDIDIVYDAISLADTQQTGNDLLVPNGSLITVLNLAITKREDVQHIQVGGILKLPQNKELLEDLYANLPQLLEEGKILPNRFQVLSGGLEGIIGGLQKLENNQVSGVKLVARPWEA